MGDKRQRARVQGAWARALPKAPNPRETPGVISSPSTAPNCWGPEEVKFEFQQPTQLRREIPAEKVIELQPHQEQELCSVGRQSHTSHRGRKVFASLDYRLKGGHSCCPQKEGEFVISQGPTGISRLRLFPSFLSVAEADWMFARLLEELPWQQKSNMHQGVLYDEPRLTCWFGELPYTYSNSTLQANPEWHPVLLGLKGQVELVSGHSFNSLLCNLYRDGKDSIAWHSDSEPSLGARPTIASLSLGDTRTFQMRKQPSAEDRGDHMYVERLRVPLAHGTLLLMDGAVQEDWQHRVPKEYHDRGARINLTFRTVYPEPGFGRHRWAEGKAHRASVQKRTGSSRNSLH
ncbi:ALKB3 dioxygenase, partial [Atractosteus spatula]|nr:ALKB3 dioxygenase [Atractosteus spatula]